MNPTKCCLCPNQTYQTEGKGWESSFFANGREVSAPLCPECVESCAERSPGGTLELLPRDGYDAQRDRLLGVLASDGLGPFRQAAEREWSEAHWMFQFANDNGGYTCPHGGCLTMVRNLSDTNNDYAAETPELTAAIRADERIPLEIAYLTEETARPAFAAMIGWHRKLDGSYPERIALRKAKGLR